MELTKKELSTFNNTNLKELLLQYDIDEKLIKGSGKNGNVLKKDRINALTKYNKRSKTNKKN